MADAQEFRYKRLLPSCNVVVTIMACLSFMSGLLAAYLFMTIKKKVSETVMIVWATLAGIYSLVSLLLIIGVWKLVKALVYLYMCMLIVSIAVYTEILTWLWKSLAAAVFAAVVISFIFLGLALNISKSISEKRRQMARDRGDD
ncbi:uncharacterized protein LOC110177992 [Drosophila serrata]|uniref:uncharacterized protein LOC110177992 n=1 Tax=Drosophila serrata TaxID=7274 RepID=UPI000A1D2A80|nr:uncharacterized protein LOC110177992 [Drosophila serrata]